MTGRLASILKIQKVVPVIRTATTAEAIQVVEGLYSAGIRVVELTTTIPDVYQLVQRISAGADDIVVGVGTLRDQDMAQAAVDNGAQFLVTYKVSEAVARVGQQHGIPYILGAATPTEMDACQALGSDIIKVFPASALGPAFIREMRGPVPELQCFPTGGIGLDQIGAWLEAGAVAVGLGGALVGRTPDPAIVRQRAQTVLQELHVDVEAVRAAGKEMRKS